MTRDDIADIHRRLESLETPTKREPSDGEDTGSTKPGCMNNWIWMLITVGCVVITAVATTYIVNESQASDSIKPPPPTAKCDKTLAFGAIYYGSNSVLAGTAHFEYAFQANLAILKSCSVQSVNCRTIFHDVVFTYLHLSLCALLSVPKQNESRKGGWRCGADRRHVHLLSDDRLTCLRSPYLEPDHPTVGVDF